jgi:hypothetical protein
MKIVGVEIFKIDELQGKAKEKAIDEIKNLMINFNFENFESDCEYFLIDELGIKGKTYYSLSYSQGDGLRIESPNFNSENIINMLNLDESTKQTIKKITNDGDLSVSTKGASRYSYHSENDVLVEFSQDVESLLPSRLMEEITNAYIELYMKVCGDLELQGYDCYKVAISDIIEHANEFNYEYFENGEIFHAKEESTKKE